MGWPIFALSKCQISGNFSSDASAASSARRACASLRLASLIRGDHSEVTGGSLAKVTTIKALGASLRGFWTEMFPKERAK